MDYSFFKSKKKQKVLMGFFYFILFFVRDSSLARKNDKLARFCDSQNLDLDCNADSANLLAKTKYYKFAFDSQLIRATNHNRSNGGVAFVFVKKFGLSTRLKSVEVQKFLQVRNCIPQDKLPVC